MGRASCTPANALWVSKQGRARDPGLFSIHAIPYAGEWRGFRCRMGLRKTARRSGVRVIQRGWCGASWLDSNWPVRHQSAIVLTLTCSRAAATRAAYRPSSRGWSGGLGRGRGRAERQRSHWPFAAVTAPPQPAVYPSGCSSNASWRAVWRAASSRRRTRTAGDVRRASAERRGRGRSRVVQAWVCHRTPIWIVVARRGLAAQPKALEEGGPLTDGAPVLCRPAGAMVRQALLRVEQARPGQVAGVDIVAEHGPVFQGDPARTA
jgi:hypothetical protein